MGREITPLDIYHLNIGIIILDTVEILFSQVRPFFALLLNLGHFGNFVPASTYYSAALGSCIPNLGRFLASNNLVKIDN